MNKVYCDVCGTAYSEKDTHCHNCGCARPAQEISAEDVQNENGTYTYVKGGRFSKANVRKRNQDKPRTEASQQIESSEDENKADRGLVIAVCVLLLAVVAVVIYIVTRFFAPGTPENSGGSVLPETTAESVVMTTSPAETTEELIVPTTEEPPVETVPETQPETQPTTVPATEANNNYYVKPYKTNKEDQKNDATTYKGVSFPLMLIDATGEVMDVDWLVEDPTICSVEGNTVTGLKRGTTKVYVIIDGETYSCIVRVK